jgi:hypothetical protein
MPNPVQPQEIIDIDGLRSKIAEVRHDTAGWIADSMGLFAQLESASARIKNTFADIRKEVSTSHDSKTLDAYTQKITSLSDSLKNQQQAMSGLQATEQQLASVQNSLSQRTEELMKRYTELNGTSNQVVAEKKRIATELVGLQSQFERLGKIVTATRPSLAATGNTYAGLAKQVSQWKTELRQLDNAFDKAGGINKFNAQAVELAQNIQRGDVALKKMDATMGQFGRNVGNYPKGVGGFASSIGNLTKSFFALEIAREAGQLLLDFGKDVLDLTAKFEKYNAILASTLGSNEAGAAAFAMIQEFAAKTNFSVDELTESYIRLANRGLRPGQEELMRLADVANATGKPMKDLVEAISDINNTERWSEFGIKAKTNGDKVSLTFKGVTKEVARTEAGVMAAITAFGGLPGVLGMTAKISDTLDGQLSNLGDNFDRLKTTIGGDLNFELKDLVKFCNLLIEALIQVWKGTLPIRDAFGVVVDAAQGVGRQIWNLVKTLFQLENASEGAQLAMRVLTVAFRIVSTIMVAMFTNLQLAVGALNIFLDTAKRVANFFGADFKVDPKATFANLIKDTARSAKQIKDIWAGTPTGPTTPIKPGAGPSVDGLPATGGGGAPVDPGKAQREALEAEKDATDKQLKLLELRFAKGLISEKQYNDQKYKIQVEGINREIALLKKGGAEKAGEIRDANNRLLGLEIQRAKDNNQEVEKRLKDGIDTEKKLTAQRLSELELMYKQGALTEAQYNEERAQAEQKGIHKIQNLLKAAGKQKTDDYIETETELNGIAAKLAEERNKAQEQAWKNAVDTVKDALKAIDDETSGDLGVKIADLDKANIKAENDIKQRVAKRKITEEQGEIELFDLKEKYLQKLAKLAEDSIAENEKRSLAAIDTLKEQGLTEEQIKEKTDLRKAEVDQNALDRQASNADKAVQITETQQQRETRAVELEAEKRKGVIEKSVELATQAVSTYFDITSAYRQRDLDNLEKQKEYELELAGENDEAKKQIETNYANRQKELRRRQAKADKIQAAFNIILNTAVGASSAAAAVATLPLVPFIIAIGALQLATVLAKPLPEFFKGKKDSYEGLGIVGDRGFEFVERKDPRTGKSSFEFAAQQQVTYLSKHDRVYTHDESKRMIQANRDIADNVRIAQPSPVYSYQTTSGLNKSDMAEVMREALAGQPRQEFHLNERGYQEYLRKQQELKQYMNARHRWP